MGIDFKVGNLHASWSYGGFHEFRKRLAAEIGMDLEELYKGKYPFPQEPLTFLLDHSDCDGILTSEQCLKLWPRLELLTASWPATDYDKIQAAQLIECMKATAKAGTVLEFR